LKLKVENEKYGEKREKFRIKRWIFWVDGNNKKLIRRINRINRIGINNNDVFNEYHFY
jgi:hypothetical protein